MTNAITPERIAEVAAYAIEQMPPELVAECQRLVELDPSCAGVRVHRVDDGWALTWVGRWLATVLDDDPGEPS